MSESNPTQADLEAAAELAKYKERTCSVELKCEGGIFDCVKHELDEQIEALRAQHGAEVKELVEALRKFVNSGDKDAMWTNNWTELYLAARDVLVKHRVRGSEGK